MQQDPWIVNSSWWLCQGWRQTGALNGADPLKMSSNIHKCQLRSRNRSKSLTNTFVCLSAMKNHFLCKINFSLRYDMRKWPIEAVQRAFIDMTAYHCFSSNPFQVVLTYKMSKDSRKKKSLSSLVLASAWRTLFMKQVLPRLSSPVIPGRTTWSEFSFSGDTMHVGFWRYTIWLAHGNTRCYGLAKPQKSDFSMAFCTKFPTFSMTLPNQSFPSVVIPCM